MVVPRWRSPKSRLRRRHHHDRGGQKKRNRAAGGQRGTVTLRFVPVLYPALRHFPRPCNRFVRPSIRRYGVANAFLWFRLIVSSFSCPSFSIQPVYPFCPQSTFIDHFLSTIFFFYLSGCMRTLFFRFLHLFFYTSLSLINHWAFLKCNFIC